MAAGGRLAPRDFNKMYYLASEGKVGFLREAVNRGLNIDAVNPNGDTGLCIAIKRHDYVAYNSFRMSGANPRHPCTYRMLKEYREFLESRRAASTQKIVGNEESLYYDEDEKSWWPWILGGAAVGGAALALGSGGGGGTVYVPDDDTIVPTNPGYGLASGITNTKNELKEGSGANNVARQVVNANAAEYVDKVQLLPDVLSNSDYLLSFVNVSDGAYFDNLMGGSLQLNDATLGINVYGDESQGANHGVIQITAENGAIGMAASNNAEIVNGSEPLEGIESDSRYGKIDITFKGNSEGDTVIGMYGDTNSTITNYGQIKGTTTQATADEDNTGGVLDGLVTEEGEGDVVDVGDDTEEDGEGEEGEEAVTQNNSGTMLGMVLFDLYTGTNLSDNTVTAENYGTIDFSAGYNSATDIAVSLIGMGSYIDDDFLNGNNDPSLAEKMELNNYGDIKLAYQGTFNLADTALKLGQGGLIGMRADAATEATNEGNIRIDLTSATMSAGSDVAAGMLSVHGGKLTNGTSSYIYDGTTAATGGTIRVVNEATSGGVSYGMLAAKGEGSQTRVYDWEDPSLKNYGLIDMQASNAYGMASFAGGDVINYGVINLGVENGQSFYTGNYGLYAAGEDLTKEVLLENQGYINVYAENSTAIYNAFAGSVEMINDGYIYLSNKATGSQVFGGNFSSAHNNGSILYKVGNSATFSKPDGEIDSAGYNASAGVVAAAVTVSGESNTTKQLFVNNSDMTIGAAYDKNVDYGGTYGTAAVKVDKQGAADNYGVISLEKFDVDFSQFNVGLWMDSAATAEAYANNYGSIVVDATNSTAIRNDSNQGGTASNFGNIYLNGKYGYGMAVTTSQGTIFNGRADGPLDSVNTIYASGEGSVGMFIQNGTGYNYGSIYLQGDNTTAIQLDGATASLRVQGNIYHNPEYDGITYFWTSNGASYTLDYPGGVEVENYTLGKATDSGKLTVSENSTVYVRGENSYLLIGDSGAELYNYGTLYASAGASPIVVSGEAKVANGGTINISGGGNAMQGADNNTILQNLPDGVINVNNGNGMYASNLASPTNYGTINVQEGVGMYLTGMTLSGATTGNNSGSINVSGGGNYGVLVNGGAAFTNQGVINVSCADCEDGEYAIGMKGESSNPSKTSNLLKIIVGEHGIGIEGGENNGEIGIGADSAIGMSGGINNGVIEGSGTGMSGGQNNGTIDIYSGTGMKNGTNNGGITVSSGTGMNNGTNHSTIDVTNGNGGMASNGGMFTNHGEITVGSGNGILVQSGGYGVNSASGTITLAGKGYGAKVEDGDFLNAGTINFSSKNGGSCANVSVGGECVDNVDETETTSANGLIYIGKNGTFINSGVVDMDGETVDFDSMRDEESGAFVVAKGGTYKADSFKGAVVAGKDIVKGGFEDRYVNENSFEGRNEGLSVSSGSYMFDAALKDDGDSIDVEMARKEFDALVEDKEIAGFLETNYKLENNEAMYDALKDAEDKATFDETTRLETGQNFYANLPRENMAVLRGLNAQEQSRILEDGLDGGSIGMDYFQIGKDAQGGLSGYADNVYSPYAGYGKKLSNGWSIGVTLRGAYADAEYDEAASSRDNKILMAFMPILYQNGGFKFLTMPSAGAGYGTYKRYAVSGAYEADTLDLYYGLYNHAEYSVDMKVAELVAEAELNLQGASMSEAEEDGGLNLQSNDSLSLEAGVGLKLRKRIQLAKERSLMLAIGAKYYHELLDPYKDLRVGMDGSPVDFGIRAYDEDKNRLQTTAEAVYKDGDFAVAAEISHNAEKESSIEGGVGVRYNF